jgi:hypothetical protein
VTIVRSVSRSWVDVGVSERSDSGSRRCGGVSSRLEQSLLLEQAEERGR